MSNVMVFFVYFYWKDHVFFSKVCVWCVRDANVRSGIPSIYYVCVYIWQRSFQRLVI